MQLVGLQPVANLLDALALFAHFGGIPNEQPLAKGGGQGVHRKHRAIGVGVGQFRQQKVDGLVGAGKPAGEPDVEHVFARGEKSFQKFAGILQVRQRGGDDLALAHHGIELLKVGFVPLEVAVVLLAVHHER